MINFLRQLRDEWEDFCYKYSDERISIAKARIEAHEAAMRGGSRRSPYTHPEDYPEGFYK